MNATKRYTNYEYTSHNMSSTSLEKIQNERPEPSCAIMCSVPPEVSENNFWSWNMAYESYEL